MKCLWIRIPENQGFAFLNVPQHVYNEPLKLNGIEFQNHFIKIEEALKTKQTRGVPLNKQNRPSLTIMPREINVVNFRGKIVNFDRQIKYKIQEGLQSGRIRFKYFPGGASEELLHYIDTT